MLDHRGSEHLKEEILVGLFFLPAAAAFFLRFRARADGDQNHAVRLRLLERALSAACW